MSLRRARERARDCEHNVVFCGVADLLFNIVGFSNSFQYALQPRQSNKVTLYTYSVGPSSPCQKVGGGNPPVGQSTIVYLYYYFTVAYFTELMVRPPKLSSLEFTKGVN
jgi:hypothetical protein